MSQPTHYELLFMLQNTNRELKRLYEIHKDQFDGKVGCPDSVVIELSDIMIDKAFRNY